MKKCILAGVIIILAAACGWYVFTGGTMTVGGAKKKMLREAQEAVMNRVDPDDVAAQTMKAIEMIQGEKGIELWRLKAEWGNMRRVDNVMELEKPRFSYFMPPDNKELRITSLRGDVDQAEQRVRFLDQVVAVYETRTVTSPSAVYTGSAKEIRFPEGASIVGGGMDGRADVVVWRLDQQTIEAQGGVDITFTAPDAKSSPEPAPAATGGRG